MAIHVRQMASEGSLQRPHQRMYALSRLRSLTQRMSITFGNTFPVREGQTVVVDDDLMLHLVKIFRAAHGSG